MTEIHVQWANLPKESATWEDYYHLKNQFPSFDTWGQGSLGGEGGVTSLEGYLGNLGNMVSGRQGRKPEGREGRILPPDETASLEEQQLEANK